MSVKVVFDAKEITLIMANFGRHLDCRAVNCNFVAKTFRELKEHMEIHAQ